MSFLSKVYSLLASAIEKKDYKAFTATLEKFTDCPIIDIFDKAITEIDSDMILFILSGHLSGDFPKLKIRLHHFLYAVRTNNLDILKLIEMKLDEPIDYFDLCMIMLEGAAFSTLNVYKYLESFTERILKIRGTLPPRNFKDKLLALVMEKAYNKRNNSVLSYVMEKSPIRLIKHRWAARVSDEQLKRVLRPTVTLAEGKLYSSSSVDKDDLVDIMMEILARGGNHKIFMPYMTPESLIEVLFKMEPEECDRFFVRSVVEFKGIEEMLDAHVFCHYTDNIYDLELFINEGYKPSQCVIVKAVKKHGVPMIKMLLAPPISLDISNSFIWDLIDIKTLVALLDSGTALLEKIIRDVVSRNLTSVKQLEYVTSILPHIKDKRFTFSPFVVDRLSRVRQLIALGVRPAPESFQGACPEVFDYFIEMGLTPSPDVLINTLLYNPSIFIKYKSLHPVDKYLTYELGKCGPADIVIGLIKERKTAKIGELNQVILGAAQGGCRATITAIFKMFPSGDYSDVFREQNTRKFTGEDIAMVMLCHGDVVVTKKSRPSAAKRAKARKNK